MFWIWFEWLCFTEPYSLESDGDTIKLNDVSLKFWQSMPEKYLGMAITINVIMDY